MEKGVWAEESTLAKCFGILKSAHQLKSLEVSGRPRGGLETKSVPAVATADHRKEVIHRQHRECNANSIICTTRCGRSDDRRTRRAGDTHFVGWTTKTAQFSQCILRKFTRRFKSPGFCVKQQRNDCRCIHGRRDTALLFSCGHCLVCNLHNNNNRIQMERGGEVVHITQCGILNAECIATNQLQPFRHLDM